MTFSNIITNIPYVKIHEEEKNENFMIEDNDEYAESV